MSHLLCRSVNIHNFPQNGKKEATIGLRGLFIHSYYLCSYLLNEPNFPIQWLARGLIMDIFLLLFGERLFTGGSDIDPCLIFISSVRPRLDMSYVENTQSL